MTTLAGRRQILPAHLTRTQALATLVLVIETQRLPLKFKSGLLPEYKHYFTDPTND